MENKFPKCWRKKQVDLKAKEIIDYLNKDFVHNDIFVVKNSNLTSKILKSIDTISTPKNKNDCCSDAGPNMQMILNCQNKSKNTCTNKYQYLDEELFQPSSNPSDSTIKAKLHEDNNSIKIRIEKDLNQEPIRNFQLNENNSDDIKDHQISKVLNDKNSPEFIYSDGSCSSIKTSSNNSRIISGDENINHSSLCSKSKNLSGFSEKEECKTQPSKNSEPDNPETPEEDVPTEKYTKEEIKDLIDEAEEAVYKQRKIYFDQFNYKSLSEYLIKKNHDKLKLCVLNDLLLSEYDLSNLEEFCEFASDPRCKDLISISSQNKITVKLDMKKNIKVLSLIKSRPCEFETLELKVHEEKCEIFCNFLTNYFPENCRHFKLSCVYGHKLRINYYFNSLINLINRVTQELVIDSWKLTQDQMITIFKESECVHSLKFKWCILTLDSVPTFGSSLEGSNIKELTLDRNVYGDNDYGFEHLIQGLSQSNGFLENLNKIYIYGWGNTEETKQKLKKYVDIEKMVIDLRS
ncbi:unnamed protein product [Moneuplotes crassus]|uniref:Uncharacterized protein n=1 Tax=Euplotes crassus TaxID=5936 RepID=A0AAD2D4G5_EUPCR|nr:unnamed protein product [Moneuplotes crassus]